jgi:hypothetical protein
VTISADRQERLSKENTDVPALPSLLHPHPLHCVDITLELTNLDAERDRQHLTGGKTLNTAVSLIPGSVVVCDFI